MDKNVKNGSEKFMIGAHHLKVNLYTPKFKNEWNQFVKISKNSTFLFDKNFMDYHSDRYKDHSLMVFDENNNLVALLPANITNGNELISHEDLTYGGIIFKKNIKLLFSISVFYFILKFLREKNIETFKLKCLPSFYKTFATDEIEYVLFLLDAQLYRRDIACVIDLKNRIPYSGNIRREGNKAEKLLPFIKEDDSFDEFWIEILGPNLMERFAVKPVHSLQEITLLKKLFPENIKQYNIYLNDKVVAGTTLFITEKVVHCQYISSSTIGRRSGCLNLLFKKLIDQIFNSYDYFDFGIVNEKEGRFINSGMLFWKEAFGGRAHKHDFYKIDTKKYSVLEQYIV